MKSVDSAETILGASDVRSDALGACAQAAKEIGCQKCEEVVEHMMD